ncbi:MAG: JAB domain-containing protein [Firmicutes bacterium]|nr:JAB domain-containing protein [Bacillota bacterium]
MRSSKKILITILLTTIIISGYTLAASAATINSARDAYEKAFPEIAGLRHEEAIVYFTDAAGEILKESRITQHRKGGIYYVPWELLFGPLLPDGAAAIYLVHNHPSGNPALSGPDIELGSFWAHRAKEIGVTLDLLAITEHNGYTSLLESGQLLSPDQLDERRSNYLSYVIQPGLKILGSGFTKVFADTNN